MATLTDFFISAAFIALYCGAAQIARKLLEKFSSIQGVLKEIILEAICAAELCSTCFELIIVADNFGVATYAVVLFLLTLWWSQVWEDSTACPYILMEDMMEGKVSPKVMAFKMLAQLIGGCAVWRIVQFFWWLEISETHQGRAFDDCLADLQVSPLAGALIEGSATMLCRLASKSLNETSLKHANILDAFVGTSLVVAAFNYSGGYFNPVLATSLKWGCGGHTEIEHLIVYWIGSCSGALISCPLMKNQNVRQMLISKDEKRKYL